MPRFAKRYLTGDASDIIGKRTSQGAWMTEVFGRVLLPGEKCYVTGDIRYLTGVNTLSDRGEYVI